jgi:hypothetical protein
MSSDLEVKVLWKTWSREFLANRKAKKPERVPVARPALKEAGSKAASRRTEIGCEAWQPRASEQRIAKPL